MIKSIEKRSGIYVLQNIENGKSYVGGTVNLKSRKRQHFSDLKLNKHKNKRLQDAYNEYSKDAFRYIILEFVDDIDNLVNKEQEWMDKLHPEYNINEIAGNYMGDYIRTPEAREKRRIKLLGVKPNISPEGKEARRLAMSGDRNPNRRPGAYPPERREKIRQATLGEKNPNYGKPRPEETRKKISVSNYKTYIGAVSPEGIVYSPIVGMREFCRQHSLNESSMVALMHNRRFQHKGWTKYTPL